MASKRREILVGALLWTMLLAAWVIVFQNETLTFTRTVGIQFCYLFFIAANFYFNSLYTIPRFLNQKKYILYGFTGILFVIFTAWLRAEVAYFINTHFYNAVVDFGTLYLNSLLNIFIWTVVLTAGKLMMVKAKAEKHAEAMEKEKIQNELDFLRAQHNPHFLFNSLNSIYFQIDKTNADAREMLMLLAEMLRYQLYECSAEHISIDREIAYLNNYIQLQRLRLNKNYAVSFSVAQNVKSFSIAPLLIMPLIENAFKYVSHYTDRSNEIKIDLGFEKPNLSCSIYNTVEKTNGESNSLNRGIGLKNLERRLALIYPGKHELINLAENNHYSARLILTVDEN